MNINPEVWQWAQWVSEKTGIPAEIIYSQWTLEAGQGGIANPASLNYNLGGLTVAGQPGVWRKYSSLSQFAWDYVYSFLLPGYPGAVGAKDINTFVAGLKQGKWGSYFGNESITSYAGKLTSVYNSLFGGNSGQQRPILEGQSIGPAPEEPLWKRIWNGFLEKIGLARQTPLPPTPQEELKAREWVIQKAQEKGIPITPEFQENTQITRDYLATKDGQGPSLLQRVLYVVIGIVLFITGALLMVRQAGVNLAGDIVTSTIKEGEV